MIRREFHNSKISYLVFNEAIRKLGETLYIATAVPCPVPTGQALSPTENLF